MPATSPPEIGTTKCWNEVCGSEKLMHRWMADPIRCQNLDEWQCQTCGLRWARWSTP